MQLTHDGIDGWPASTSGSSLFGIFTGAFLRRFGAQGMARVGLVRRGRLCAARNLQQNGDPER